MTSFNVKVEARSLQKNERGLTGLINIGNTCFLNSIVQCLSNTKPLLEYILNEEYVNEIRNPSRCLLTKRFTELILNIWAEQKGLFNTNNLKNAVVVYAPRFNGNSQQDAQEFFRYLLEGLHEEINRVSHTSRILSERINTENLVKSESTSAEETWQRYLRADNSKIVDIFGGLLKSILKCTLCGFSSIVFEPFWDLSLSIPSNHNIAHFQKLNLNHCLDFFTKEEILDGNEKPVCSKCKSRRACVKKILIQKFPQVLVIHLKRFSTTGTAHKVDSYIDFPVIGLNMTAYSAEAKLKKVVYNLYAVVNHFGTCQFGHYTANCKHPYSDDWHCFNDRVVSLMDPEVTNKSEAYILFYEVDN